MDKTQESQAKIVCEKRKWQASSGDMFGMFYCVAVIGVAVYYIQQSDTFWQGVLGVLKALVWPAMLMYKVFTLLAM